VEVGETESQGLGSIGHVSVLRGIGRFREAFGAGDRGTVRDVLVLSVLKDVERSVFLKCHFEERRSGAGEMAQDKLAVFVAAGKRARIAVNAEDRGGHVRTRLAYYEAPR